MTRFDLSKTYYPSTATLEEAQGVVATIREKLTWANGEYAGELRDDLSTWERVVAEITARKERDEAIGRLLEIAGKEAARLHDELGLSREVLLGFDESGVFTQGPDGVRRPLPDPMQPMYDEQDAAAIEEDRRFEQFRDDQREARR